MICFQSKNVSANVINKIKNSNVHKGKQNSSIPRTHKVFPQKLRYIISSFSLFLHRHLNHKIDSVWLLFTLRKKIIQESEIKGLLWKEKYAKINDFFKNCGHSSPFPKEYLQKEVGSWIILKEAIKSAEEYLLTCLLMVFQKPEFLVMLELKHGEKVQCFSPGLLALIVQIYWLVTIISTTN